MSKSDNEPQYYFKLFYLISDTDSHFAGINCEITKVNFGVFGFGNSSSFSGISDRVRAVNPNESFSNQNTPFFIDFIVTEFILIAVVLYIVCTIKI